MFDLESMDYAALFADSFKGWQDSQAAIRSMADSARKRKIPALVVIFPSFQGNMDDHFYSYLEAHEKIKSVARENRLPVFDLRPVYAKINPRGNAWWAIPVDMHPGVEGHRIAGKAIAAELLREGLMPKTGKSRL